MSKVRRGYFARNLAPYASIAAQTGGRVFDEPESPTRTCFQRDRDRIIHSTAFRRLKYKTQVFIYHEGDHYRTRLTHSIEVSQIARSLARALSLDEDLAEALALAHDLGHPPFGHAGERALSHAMTDYDGFDHNAQTLRIVTFLERRYAAFDGLNLTADTLQGIVKHNGPLLDTAKSEFTTLPFAIRDYRYLRELELWTHPSLEAQVAAIADDIAYDSHDIDDGVRAGLIQIEDLARAPLIGPCIHEVREKYPDLQTARLVHESLRRLISKLVGDVFDTARRAIDEKSITNAGAVQNCGQMLAVFSPEIMEKETALKVFLRQHMYRHANVIRVMKDAEKVVTDLFQAYIEGPDQIPDEWRDGWGNLDEKQQARRICDFVAGMTDRYALQEHSRLFDLTPDLR